MGELDESGGPLEWHILVVGSFDDYSIAHLGHYATPADGLMEENLLVDEANVFLDFCHHSFPVENPMIGRLLVGGLCQLAGDKTLLLLLLVDDWRILLESDGIQRPGGIAERLRKDLIGQRSAHLGRYHGNVGRWRRLRLGDRLNLVENLRIRSRLKQIRILQQARYLLLPCNVVPLPRGIL